MLVSVWVSWTFFLWFQDVQPSTRSPFSSHLIWKKKIKFLNLSCRCFYWIWCKLLLLSMVDGNMIDLKMTLFLLPIVGARSGWRLSWSPSIMLSCVGHCWPALFLSLAPYQIININLPSIFTLPSLDTTSRLVNSDISQIWSNAIIVVSIHLQYLVVYIGAII